MEIIPKELPVRELYGFLVGSVAPRPIAFVSTVDKEGHVNLSPFSFFNVFGTSPPVLVFSPTRGRNETLKNTYENIRQTMEVVVNVVTYDMVRQMNLTSAEFPKFINEFSKGGFTPVASDLVTPPRVKESPVNFECSVLLTYETSNRPAAGNLVICEVIKIHIDDHILGDDGKIDPLKIDLVGRMGGSYYSRAKEGLFTVERPKTSDMLGIDRLPKFIRNSTYLSGNDLGLLGGLTALPTEDEIRQIKKVFDVEKILLENKRDRSGREKELHQYARLLIQQEKVKEALAVLMLCKEK
jgi:flavin reductase (DIM6/NTAB) family NADH-FMN oxidoreductase RutF